MVDVSGLKEEYADWIRINFEIHEERDGWVSITTPFLDRHNDNLVIYVTE